MTEYKTNHAIGDLVYIANSDDVDRDVIKAIKIVGVKGEIHYGIEKKQADGYMSFFFNNNPDAFTWYKTSEVFDDKESAEAHHGSLKSKKDAEEAIRQSKERAERRAELKAELDELDSED